MRYKIAGLVICSFLTAVLRSCNAPPPGADLIPVIAPGQPNNVTGFCKTINNQAKIIVVAKNQGAADAVSSNTRVEFSVGGTTVPSAPQNPGRIPAGGSSAPLIFDIPAGCSSPDCHFKIVVDFDNQTPESNEGNNSADGTCIG